jgi:glycosyltransferase involved in cell wall biosynthesis
MKKLIIFNLQTDPSSPVLGAAIDWIEAFKTHFEVTDIVSTHVGTNVSLKNTKILEIVGGNLRARFIAITRLLRFALHLIPNRRDYVVFHHMSPRTAVFPGILFKMFGIPQSLWYSHSSKPITLKISSRVVDWIFSSEENSLPIRSSKAHFVGHGIPLNKFENFQSMKRRESAVIFLGRLSRIKNLRNIIEEIALLENKIPITLIGPQSDKVYLEELKEVAFEKNIDLTIKDYVSHDQVNSIMNRFKYFYSGMEESVDKSALEAAISGCLVLTTDIGTQDLSGMKEIWNTFTHIDNPTIHKQIQILEGLNAEELFSLQKKVQSEAIKKNSLEKTISKISSVMEVRK